jgi:Mrp family chromosome partitioning ATPase
VAETGGAEPGKPPPVASLERALDQVLEFLGRAEQTSRVRALTIEARRLRNAVGNWRSIAPPADVRDEMITRVLRLASDAEEIVASMEQEPPAAEPVRGPSTAITLVLPTNLDLAPAPSAPLTASAAPLLASPAAKSTDLSITMPIMEADALDAAAPPSVPALDDDVLPRLPSLVINVNRESALAAPSHRAPPSALRLEVIPREVQITQGPPDLQVGNAPIDGPPSLQIDHAEPPPSSAFDGAKTLTAIPVPGAALAPQAISVWAVPPPERVNPEIVMLSDPYSKRADAYRNLRRKLMSGTAKTIAVTSAMPQEGKTICAINLALAFAEVCPRNVLLVEANIRSPGVAAALKFEPPSCFVQQLKKRRKDPFEPWVMVEQAGPSTESREAPASGKGALHLLAVDARTERPPMLDAVEFSKGMQSLKLANYEYIILDTPPVLGAMDMSIIGDAVDGVVIVSLVRKSTRKSLRLAIEQLKPAPVLGVVVLER